MRSKVCQPYPDLVLSLDILKKHGQEKWEGAKTTRIKNKITWGDNKKKKQITNRNFLVFCHLQIFTADKMLFVFFLTENKTRKIKTREKSPEKKLTTKSLVKKFCVSLKDKRKIRRKNKKMDIEGHVNGNYFFSSFKRQEQIMSMREKTLWVLPERTWTDVGILFWKKKIENDRLKIKWEERRYPDCKSCRSFDPLKRVLHAWYTFCLSIQLRICSRGDVGHWKELEEIVIVMWSSSSQPLSSSLS